MIVTPDLLKSNVKNVPSRVFVCGPGFESDGINLRDKVKETLESYPNVKAIYGEEIEPMGLYRGRKTDLQSLEVLFAHDVDFTLLLLESAGAIAELGTFSQMQGVRNRLVVLVSENHYRTKSYIARGPLSLISKANPNSVVYFPSNEIQLNKLALDALLHKVKYSLAFYKFARARNGYDYLKNTRWSHKPQNINAYADYIKPLQEEYETAIALISILIEDEPSYAKLLLTSGLGAERLSRALHSLYNQHKIGKIKSGRYIAKTSLDDPILSSFSSTEISKLRAKVLAA